MSLLGSGNWGIMVTLDEAFALWGQLKATKVTTNTARDCQRTFGRFCEALKAGGFIIM